MAVHSRDLSALVLTGDLVANEIPTGDINSLNTIYTLANVPVAGTVQVILNGSTQSPGSGKDYTITGKIITFYKAPRTGSEVICHYIKV